MGMSKDMADVGMSEKTIAEKEPDDKKPPIRFGHFKRGIHIPIFFLGLAAYRAWIEIVFVGSFVDYPTHSFAGHDVFDAIMVCFLLLSAALSKKISPFYCRGWVYAVTGIAMLVSTAGSFSSVFFPEYASLLAWPSAIAGGLGIALIILLWSELYGCLNPVRVALYYSASLVCAALIVYLYYGLQLPWLFAATLLLPLISLFSVSRGFNSLPLDELPSNAPRFSFPWKIVLLMAVYAFAFGLKEAETYSESFFGPHAAPGTLAIALLIFIGVFIQGGKFGFDKIYRIGLPLMVGAFLILPSFNALSASVAGFCVTASYAAFSILVMLIFSNICYRYGISAVWLFGIERGIRAIFGLFGRIAADFMVARGIGEGNGEFILASIVIIVVVVMTMLLLSEQELALKWGVTFLTNKNVEKDNALIREQELLNRCDALAKKYGLSKREGEVLEILAQKKTIGEVEKELYIANGTAKTHIRHIYRKLDIHSREELYDMLEIGGHK